jgi:hypothetical protein
MCIFRVKVYTNADYRGCAADDPVQPMTHFLLVKVRLANGLGIPVGGLGLGCGHTDYR